MGANEHRRIDYLDTAKGLGIIMVCVGHACTNQSSVMNCKLADVIRFVTLFHMALFFFINGMLYNSKYSERPVWGIFHKVKSYYIPFVMYNVLFWLLHNLFARLHLISGSLDPKDYAYAGIKAYLVSFVKTLLGFRQRFAGAMWFLEALIVISVVFVVVDHLATKVAPRKRYRVLSIIVVSIVLLNRLLDFSSIPGIPSSLTQMVYWGLNGLLFFYLGYIYKSFQWNEKLHRYKVFLIWGCLFLLVIAVIVMKPRVISVITNASIPVYRYGLKVICGGSGISGLPLMQYLLYAVVCACGIIMTILFSQIGRVRDCKVLKLFGRYSLHIMCLQFLAFKSISLLIIWIYRLPIERLAEYPVVQGIDGLWWIAYAVSGCVLPVLVVKLFEKLKTKVISIYKRSRTS